MEPNPPSSTPPPEPTTPPPAPPGSPATPPGSAKAGGKRPPPLPQLVTELRDLVVRYVREQTLVPLQQLGRYVGFGVAGSLLLGFGVVFLGMAGLRALQDETGDTFTGDWSWVPYLIMFVALLVGAGLVWVARTARRAEKEYG
jgi:hypothetical protein